MINGLLGSAPSVLRPNGEVYIGITGSINAKGRTTLLSHLESGTIEVNGNQYSVRRMEIDPDHTLRGDYPTRRTEGGRIRTSRGPKQYYIFTLLTQ